MKNNKIVNIRALSILIVVLGHSIILYSSSWGFYESVNKVVILDKLKDIINLIQMPLFFSLSGFLFYYTINKNSSLKEFFLKKVKRLLIPFITIGLFWMIPIKLLVNYPAYQNIKLIKIIEKLLIGTDSGHLWYLPTLFIIFLIMYILKNVINKKHNLLFLLVLILLEIISNNLNLCLYVKQSLHYMYFFYIGFLIKKHEKVDLNLYGITLCLLISFFLVKAYGNIEIISLIFATLFILFIYKVMSEKENKFVKLISDNSYGIYLLHSPLIYITYTYFANISPIIVVFLNLFVFGGISLFLSYFIKKQN